MAERGAMAVRGWTVLAAALLTAGCRVPDATGAGQPAAGIGRAVTALRTAELAFAAAATTVEVAVDQGLMRAGTARQAAADLTRGLALLQAARAAAGVTDADADARAAANDALAGRVLAKLAAAGTG